MKPFVIFFFVLVLLATVLVSAESAIPPDSKRKIELPVDHWLAEGDYQDFKAKTEIYTPRLTFQQRYIVRVRATIDLHTLQKTGIERDFHFLIKVADKDGHWFPDETYAKSAFATKLKQKTDLEVISEMHFLPGDYTICTIVYDRVQQQRNVQSQKFHVPEIKDDPLPDLTRDLAPVEFLPESEQNVLQFGGGRARLPVRTLHPIHIDLVFDLGAPRQTTRTGFAEYAASQQILAASLLSQMDIHEGCLQITAIDVLRQEVVFRREDAREIDWFKKRKEALGRNLNVIAVNKLDTQHEAGAFFRDAIEQLMVEPPQCIPRTTAPLRRMVIVVTSGVLFPPRTALPEVRPSQACNCQFYYLRVGRLSLFDDLTKILKPLSPRKIQVDDPYKFRKEIKRLLVEIQQFGE